MSMLQGSYKLAYQLKKLKSVLIEDRYMKHLPNDRVRQFLQVFCMWSFRNTAYVPTVLQFCPNPAKHNLVHFLYGSSNPNLQRYTAVWYEKHINDILRETP
jgi:hypothetical protein